MNTTCLIIDDEKLARELLTEYLEPFSEIEILGECANGIEAVEKIDKLKPDLIFLDVQMPGINGFNVLEEIDHEPYVIFTTAYDQYAIKAFEKNAVDYLLKPLDEERFRLAVNRALKQKQLEQSNIEDLLDSLRGERKASYDS
ncbi:MAG: response regulator, partial [Bacteroidia bacterium]|nr:response regulator [Bacteroidia bacterium]